MIGSALVVSMITFCNYTKVNNNGNNILMGLTIGICFVLQYILQKSEIENSYNYRRISYVRTID